ncbi:transglutaminase family protein [Aliiglaciecola sp. 3_MG-2023]|uniref:transglutaminase family protein n=1 Tax=Aliiglaciecola sp. 3_MG-2023 TaxID=3062644 RepID=UPI0026E129B8|nr:transglutaminase family protein [Aliiglaciecola sp. 3_MG-2023]MDO6694495.1 transglutaminase family protein [Aliiglaciecola sp. 3_MG-2023]
MILRIEHLTRHTYSGPVSFSGHSLYLHPVEGHQRRVHSFSIATIPPAQQSFISDVEGNSVVKCNFGLTESDILEFKTVIHVEINDDNPYDFLLEPYAIEYPFDYRGDDLRSLTPYRLGEDQVDENESQVLSWFQQAVPSPAKHPDIVQFLTDINQAIGRDISYVRRDEEGIQSPNLTLASRSGSCRDMAMLFISAVRQLGLAARFVSGYLFDPPSSEEGNHSFNRAVGSMHAWAEVYLPGAGWKGFDPTNGILANSFFIPTAVSHNPDVIAPIQGHYFSKHSTEAVLDIQLHIEEVNIADIKPV